MRKSTQHLLKIVNIINSVKIPSRWIEEGVIAPTKDCRDKAKERCCYLFKEYGWLPVSIRVSKQEGLYIVYDGLKKGRKLSLEIDNGLNCDAQVYDGNMIFITGDLEHVLSRDFV